MDKNVTDIIQSTPDEIHEIIVEEVMLASHDFLYDPNRLEEYQARYIASRILSRLSSKSTAKS